MELTRQQLADLILKKLNSQKELSKTQFLNTENDIGYFFVDDLLPNEIVAQIHSAFPSSKNTMLKKSIREYKHVAAQLDLYEPILEEITYAFQDPRIVKLISEITGIENPLPDENLYAGGISMMSKDHFLNPHLDNSHDKDRNLWRVLNLLFYVTPDWKESYGGNLEIWPKGLESDQITIQSKFNRLAVMATHNASWHSVSQVTYNGTRCCVSNYYFSEKPLLSSDKFHVTSFRGRPGQYIIDSILRIDASMRMGLRKLFKKGIKENKHVYKKKG